LTAAVFFWDAIFFPLKFEYCKTSKVVKAQDLHNKWDLFLKKMDFVSFLQKEICA